MVKKSVERCSLVMQWYKTPSGGKGSSKNIDGYILTLLHYRLVLQRELIAKECRTKCMNILITYPKYGHSELERI